MTDRMPDQPENLVRPRLVADNVRAWAATGVVAVVALSVVIAALFALDLAYVPSLWLSIFTSWVAYGLAYLALTLWAFHRARGETLRTWLRETSPRRRSARLARAISGGGASSWAAQASLLAIIAVVVLSVNTELRSTPVLVIGGVAVVVSSWILMVTSYAVHYAREDAERRVFAFDGDEPDEMGDWFYLSVQVSTTFSTSDVTPTTSHARRMITTHSVIAFAFNTIVVALAVSLLVASV